MDNNILSTKPCEIISMKKVRNLCLIAALSLIAVGGSSFYQIPVNAVTTKEVSNSGTSLKDALAKAKSGDIVNITGTVNVLAGVTITGEKREE